MNMIMLGLFSAFIGAEGESKPELEAIYGVTLLDESRIEFQVKSTGCTKAQDFSLSYQDKHIRLLRHKTDKCRRKPYLKSIVLSLPELEGPFSLGNPIAAHSLKK
ncbi:hypothetical protein [Pseudoteredinibacter isoporae]|uniref:Uncharacterized protein n=1 Tax=Pseudoteredinibacter isoporae TaxID=570281 RepID=A0A7X0MTY7_9GAMM|nr:hypothetical protein [Pseudoteredinibacter isoporae]MBB6520051.1 hypothetical protein [Pseudoteredinibacter isoporae]NHO85623.1 hypothetical protein [Pseudoteredinibacter isoporae]NIB25925.1 hypothetical protein [Pseudoteredinibacter isoporae]